MKEVYLQLNMDDALRDFYKQRCGCVLRAAGSLFGVPPTEKEWDERIRVFQGIGLILDIVLMEREPRNLDELMDYAVLNLEDHSRVVDFFQTLPGSESPLGEKAKNYEMTIDRLSKWQIRKKLQNRSKVLISTTTHLAHVDYIPGKGFISLSDDSIPYRLRPSQRYEVFLFKPRA